MAHHSEHHHQHHSESESHPGDLNPGFGTAGPMAAITALTNPVSQDKYLVFFNDANNLLGSAQQFKTVIGHSIHDFGREAIADVPNGSIANPSSMASVLFETQVNTYGVFKAANGKDLLVCRLSPGFQRLNIGGPALSADSSSIAACSDGNQKGWLFYLVKDANQVSLIRAIALPGTDVTSSPTAISLNLNPTTYLGAAYGAFPSKAADAYVGLQNYQNFIYVCSRINPNYAAITQAKGLKNTPIAMVFVGTYLVVYFFGGVGDGNDPNASPVYRAVTNDLSRFNFVVLDNAPYPNGYTQLAAFANPSPNNEGLGTVILTYVQKDSDRLVSWQDDLHNFTAGLRHESEFEQV